MQFKYRARTKAGIMEAGTIEASSQDAAALLLQKYNLFVVALEEQKPGLALSKDLKIEGKISKKELAIFFRQLSVMLESRVPVVQSLSSLAVQVKKDKFKKTLLKVNTLVQEGKSLSEALATFPKIFDVFTINLIKSGEASGNIAQALSNISEHLEKDNDLVSQVRQAMIYPAFVFLVLAVVITIIIVVVMPKIVSLINESGTKPSFFTSLMLSFYQFLGRYWWAVLILVILSVVALIYYFSTKTGKQQFNVVVLKLPVLGDLLKKVYLTRFCSNISTLLIAGISINKALKITEDTVNNLTYKAIIVDIEKQVSEGEKISTALGKHEDYFPSFVVQMIKVGEDTGKLDKTLQEVVIFYQKEVKVAIALFLGLLEPLMIIFVGLIVGALAVSVLMPLYGALGTVG